MVSKIAPEVAGKYYEGDSRLFRCGDTFLGGFPFDESREREA
jgi:hypothetical protein